MDMDDIKNEQFSEKLENHDVQYQSINSLLIYHGAQWGF